MRRAFTLIELWVVITIIAILAALLFPVFAQAKIAGKTAATISNLRQLGQAAFLYAGDADDVYPLVAEGYGGIANPTGYTYYGDFSLEKNGPFDPARGSLFPYVKSAEIYRSALDPDGASRQSFAFNGCLAVFPPPRRLMPTQSTTQAESPARIFLFSEESTEKGSTNDGFFYPLVDHLGEWHFGKAAMVFADGHAKTARAVDRFAEFVYGQDQPCWPYEPLIGE
jgi:prepilin-type N-terminal cleavage/methylation domain-containing protein/prepilin-type processing-associated H-X9-DG protein